MKTFRLVFNSSDPTGATRSLEYAVRVECEDLEDAELLAERMVANFPGTYFWSATEVTP